MTGPWDDYAAPSGSPATAPAADGPWADYAPSKRSQKEAVRASRVGQYNAVAQGMTFGWSDELAGGAANLATRGKNAFMDLMHRPGPREDPNAVGDATTQHFRDIQNDYQAAHPVGNIANQVVGGSLVPGGPVAKFVGKGVGLVGTAARSALVGASSGALAGAGNAEGGASERAAGAGQGAMVGAALGAAVPALGAVARTGARAVNAATGGKMAPAANMVRDRLAEALRADKVDEATIQRAIADWSANGNDAPSLLDVAGNNTMRLIRAAGAKPGSGQNVAEAYATTTRTSAAGRGMKRADELAPGAPSPAERKLELQTQRGDLADKQYAAPYAEQVSVTPELQSALSDEPGRAAIRRARAAAVARRKPVQVGEMDALLAADFDPPELAVHHGSPVKDLQRLAPMKARGTFDFPPVVSLSTSEEFARHYAGEGGKVYGAAVPTKNVGDFRKPENVQRVLDFYSKRHGPLDANDVEAVKHGAWRLWENADLWRESGWKGAFVREEPGTSNANTLNISLASGDDVRLGASPKPHAAPPTHVSAATLDRIKIAMGKRGETLNMRPDTRDIAGGMFERAAAIDGELGAVPGLQEARSTFKGLSEQIDGLDVGAAALTLPPSQFVPQAQNLSPAAKQEAVLSLRQKLIDTFGDRVNAAGRFDDLGWAQDVRANLTELLGKGEAERMIQFARNEATRLNRGKAIAPNTGSQTEGRTADQGLRGLYNAVKNPVQAVLDKLAAGATLTDAERELLVKGGTGPAGAHLGTPAPPTLAHQQQGRISLIAPNAFMGLANAN